MTRLRGFELISNNDDSALLPHRETTNAAGYDIKSGETISIDRDDVVLVKTGIKAYMQKDEVLYLFDRSSTYRRKGLVLINSVGVIDSDYYNNAANEGQIMVQFRNVGNKPVIIEYGERIAQAVFMPILFTDNDIASDKTRNGGFGSTKQ